MANKVRIGIVGCGNISGAYFSGAQKTDILEVKSCADIRPEAAQAQAAKYGCQAVTVEELMADPEIDIVVNLTIPRAHAEIALKALESGKHTHSEKPLAVNLTDAKKLIETGKAKGLRVGCAPDTFLGGGIQTSRKLLDEGAIGRPVAGVAFMCGHGPEGWHPNPAFLYDVGAGPMLDMGPYYVTALVNLLGPVKRVAAITTKAFEERFAVKQNRSFPVNTTTHLAGTLEFVNGTVVTMIMSFDIWHNSLPRIELYGTEGSMSVPDPNTFGGPVAIAKPGSGWQNVELAFPQNARMIGVVDMARAIMTGRPHRASGELAYHVLEVMLAFDKSSKTGEHVWIESSVERPAPLPTGLPEWATD